MDLYALNHEEGGEVSFMRDRKPHFQIRKGLVQRLLTLHIQHVEHQWRQWPLLPTI